MKLITSLILAAALLHATTVQAQSEPPAQPKGMVLVGFALAIVAAGVGVTIYILHHYNTSKPVTVVLEKSYDNGNWTPVFTNTVTLNGTNAIEFFHDQMTDSVAFYRARIVW